MSKDKKDDKIDTETIINVLSKILINLEKKGLEFKECNCDDERVQYYKGKDLIKMMKENIKDICESINKSLNMNINSEIKYAIQEVYNIYHKYNILKKAIREEGDKKKKIKCLLPYEKLALIYRCNCAKDHEKEDLDHKPKYVYQNILEFNDLYYYTVNIVRSSRSSKVYLSLIIGCVLLYVLLPIWPYNMKLALWWISYILLILIIGLLLIRLFIYLFFYIFGLNVWIFPNLNEDKGFFESFTPFISYEKRNEKWYTIIIRISLTIFTSYVSIIIYKNPKLIDDAKVLIYDALRDVYLFGENKFVNGTSSAISVKYKTRTMKEIDDII